MNGFPQRELRVAMTVLGGFRHPLIPLCQSGPPPVHFAHNVVAVQLDGNLGELHVAHSTAGGDQCHNLSQIS
jgi:hypothetical protein